MVKKLTADQRKRAALAAIDAGDLEALRETLGLGLKLNQRINAPGQTALSYAVMENRKAVIRFLLEQGADPNILTKRKTNPLHYVKEVEVAQWLLEAGADLHQVSVCGQEVSHYAVTFNRHPVTRFYNELLGKARSTDALISVEPMASERFWSLIRAFARKGGRDESKMARELFMDFRYRPLEEIIAFEKAFRVMQQRCVTAELRAAAFILWGGRSGDDFAAFRSWLVSLGEATVERVIKNPDAVIKPWRSRVLYHNFTAYDVPALSDMARMAYASASGQSDFQDILDASDLPTSSDASAVMHQGALDDVEELRRRFPKIWAARA